MFSVMQPPRTLREAETKKGRCSVSGNGPLTFPRQLDVVADVVIVTRTLDTESLFRKCGENRNSRAHRPFHETKPQIDALSLSGVAGMSRICRTLPDWTLI